MIFAENRAIGENFVCIFVLKKDAITSKLLFKKFFFSYICFILTNYIYIYVYMYIKYTFRNALISANIVRSIIKRAIF